MTVTSWGMTVLALAQVAGAVAVWRAARAARAIESKIAHQHEALSLLAETSESGFQAVASELQRLGAAQPPASRPSTRRMSAAAKRGVAVGEIAAAEAVSEGEVSLRLHMAEQSPKREGRRASLRA